MSTRLRDLVHCFFAQQRECWQPRDLACLPLCLSSLLTQICREGRNEQLDLLVQVPSTLTLPVALPVCNQAQDWGDVFNVILSCSPGKQSTLELLRVLCSPLLHPAKWSHRNGTCLAENVEPVAEMQPERLSLLYSALVTAKLASCIDFTNSTNGMDALAWNCLEAVNSRCIELLRSGASKQPHSDVRHEVLSVLLIEMLLPVMRQSARARDQLQYRAQAAVSMALSIVHLGGTCSPAIADAIVNNGKSFFVVHRSVLCMQACFTI